MQYGYDRDGNVLYEDNLVDSGFSELFHANSSSSGDDNAAYDNLNRVVAFRVGTLTASGNNGTTLDTITTANLNSVSGVESTDTWTYDALGNWTASDPDGTSESNTFNSQNQETAQGSNTLSYDSNGNMLTDEQGYHYVYDAWNRLVTVKNQADTSTKETFVYDALGRAVVSDNGSGNDHAYYSTQGQVLQQQYTTDYSQNVWGLGYVNNLVLRDRNADNNMSTGNLGISGSGLEEREYSLADADWSVIALANTSGAATERFAYDPYGKLAILTSSWGSGSDGSNYWGYFFQGMRLLDDGTNYSMFRSLTRIYDIDLGRWGQEDPTGYVNGPNMYQTEGDDPANHLDPTGLSSQQVTQARQDLTDAVQDFNSELDILGAILRIMYDSCSDSDNPSSIAAIDAWEANQMVKSVNGNIARFGFNTPEDSGSTMTDIVDGGLAIYGGIGAGAAAGGIEIPDLEFVGGVLNFMGAATALYNGQNQEAIEDGEFGLASFVIPAFEIPGVNIALGAAGLAKAGANIYADNVARNADCKVCAMAESAFNKVFNTAEDSGGNLIKKAVNYHYAAFPGAKLMN